MAIPFRDVWSRRLVHAVVAGAAADLLRCRSTSAVLAHKVVVPSTLGTFLRAFSFGHVRQLDKVSEAMFPRAVPRRGADTKPMTL
jgi:hypothetical protein